MFSSKLSWRTGVMLYNTALDLSIVLKRILTVKFWQAKRLQHILGSDHYAVIHIITGIKGKSMELVVLRSLLLAGNPRSQSTRPLYPALQLA